MNSLLPFELQHTLLGIGISINSIKCSRTTSSFCPGGHSHDQKGYAYLLLCATKRCFSFQGACLSISFRVGNSIQYCAPYSRRSLSERRKVFTSDVQCTLIKGNTCSFNSGSFDTKKKKIKLDSD